MIFMVLNYSASDLTTDNTVPGYATVEPLNSRILLERSWATSTRRRLIARRFAEAAAQLVDFLLQFDHAQFPADHGAVELIQLGVAGAERLCFLPQRCPVAS